MAICAKHRAEREKWFDVIGDPIAAPKILAALLPTQLIQIGSPAVAAREAATLRGNRLYDLVRSQAKLIADACAEGKGCEPAVVEPVEAEKAVA